MPKLLIAVVLAATSLLGICSSLHAQTVSPVEARAIAKEAAIYGFPLVDSYRIQYSYFVDRGSPEFKASWNTLVNNARVYTPDDKAIQTPNSDTPYSYVGADLRAEPLVFTVPAIEKGRYYSLQFIDMYTFNFAYVGSRATGNGAGSYLLAGPKWKGEKPKGIKSVIRSETEFAFVLYRTQLFNPGDIDNVKKIQAGYKVQTLSEFLGKPAPPPPPAVDFIKPLTAEQERTSLAVLQRAEFHSAVLSDQSRRESADGALCEDRHRGGEVVRREGALARDAQGTRRTAWPTPGRRSPITRKRNSTPARRPAPMASAPGPS